MPIKTSGVISVSDINIELNRPSNAVLTINSLYPRILAGKPTGQISMSDFYGKSAGTTPQIAPTTMNLTLIIEKPAGAPSFNWQWSGTLINLANNISCLMPVERVLIVSDSGGRISNPTSTVIIDGGNEQGIYDGTVPREQFLAGLILSVGGTGEGVFYGTAIVRAENLLGWGNDCTINYTISAGSGDGAIG